MSSWPSLPEADARDGIIDFRLDDDGEFSREIIRIRSMRKVGFDAKWRQLKIRDNFEVSLEKQSRTRGD